MPMSLDGQNPRVIRMVRTMTAIAAIPQLNERRDELVVRGTTKAA
jgi:hypothetical protein